MANLPKKKKTGDVDADPFEHLPQDQRQAFQELESSAEIMHLKDAVEPILAKPVSAAVNQWKLELDHPELLEAVGIKPRNTAILYGPPGTGKTTLAHAFAAQRGLPLVAIQSEKLMSSYFSESGSNVGRMFDLITRVADRCVVLFDEFESLATKRGVDRGGGAQNERNAVIAVILRRLEQFQGIAIAATNTDKHIDPAIWRRFGLQISVDLPDELERFAIMSRYFDPYELPDEDLKRLVQLTGGASPSLLRQLCEGVKRTLALAPVIPSMDVSDPVAVFAQVVMSISPPREILEKRTDDDGNEIETPIPALWFPKRARQMDAIQSLSKLDWPLERKPDEPDREAA